MNRGTEIQILIEEGGEFRVEGGVALTLTTYGLVAPKAPATHRRMQRALMILKIQEVPLIFHC